jgi:hypothetical protein
MRKALFFEQQFDVAFNGLLIIGIIQPQIDDGETPLLFEHDV